MFSWADESPVAAGGDGPHAVWRCVGCWERNSLTLVATALPYQAKRGMIRFEVCELCDDHAEAHGAPIDRRPWKLILIGGTLELDPDGAGQGSDAGGPRSGA